MPSFNILARISHVLTFFTAAEQREIVLAINAFRKADAVTKGFVVDAFQLTTISTTAAKKGFLIEIVRKIAYEQIRPNLFRVHQGSTFCISFNLKTGQNLTGTRLTARNAEGFGLLSANNIAGSAVTQQDILIDDLPLTAGALYKIYALAEVPDGGGLASGNATTPLVEGYYIVTQDIDAV